MLSSNNGVFTLAGKHVECAVYQGTMECESKQIRHWLSASQALQGVYSQIGVLGFITEDSGAASRCWLTLLRLWKVAESVRVPWSSHMHYVFDSGGSQTLLRQIIYNCYILYALWPGRPCKSKTLPGFTLHNFFVSVKISCFATVSRPTHRTATNTVMAMMKRKWCTPTNRKSIITSRSL